MEILCLIQMHNIRIAYINMLLFPVIQKITGVLFEYVSVFAFGFIHSFNDLLDHFNSSYEAERLAVPRISGEVPRSVVRPNRFDGKKKWVA